MFSHEPVLLQEVVGLFVGEARSRFLDGTIGGGGHAERLLAAGVGGALYLGLDRDPAAVQAAGERLHGRFPSFVVRHARYSEARQVLAELGVSGVDGVLVDLGVSSPQLDVAERGFAFREAGPLDMRMDPTRGEGAAELLDRLDEGELAGILRRFGEVPGARRLAAGILDARARGRVETTTDLARLVEAVAPKALRGKRVHPATRVFQALRMAVNDELGELERFLADLPELLNVGGRAGIISFHSLEDRVVKQAFRELAGRSGQPPPGVPLRHEEPAFRELFRKAVAPSEEEVARNPRARSAKLRGIEKVGERR
jgi:16S rRNA (cytosine1402-N4)-methyltransferase